MPNNEISQINPTGQVGGEYKLKDSVSRGLFFESEDDYEEAVSQGLLNDLPDGTMIYTPSTGGGGGGGSTTVVEELSDIEAMTVFNGEAAGAKAVKTLKQAFSDALTALKNTAIAQAVGATGSTFTAVINKLAEIVNNGDTSKTITAGTSNKTSSIPAGYTSGGTVTVKPTPSQTKTVTSSRSAQTVTPDSGYLLSQVTVNKFPDASGTFSVTSNGTHDMGATNNHRYVSVNVVTTPQYVTVSGNRSASFVLNHNTNLLVVATGVGIGAANQFNIYVNNVLQTKVTIGNIGNISGGWGLGMYYVSGNFTTGSTVTIQCTNNNYGGSVIG